MRRVLKPPSNAPQPRPRRNLPSSGLITTVVYGLGNNNALTSKHSVRAASTSIGQYVLLSLAKLASDGKACFWEQDKSLEGFRMTVHRDASNDHPAQKVVFVKSKHLMNSSGKTARLIDKAWPELIPSGKLLVIHDVLNLEPTQTMPRKDGLDQGHLGVRDVMETLRTTNFHRFAIGIGRPSAQARRRGTTAEQAETAACQDAQEGLGGFESLRDVKMHSVTTLVQQRSDPEIVISNGINVSRKAERIRDSRALR
ncbi:hypothetical protein EMMF5_005667 [Cystobasidiomycetes sp. EMM_F5]